MTQVNKFLSKIEKNEDRLGLLLLAGLFFFISCVIIAVDVFMSHEWVYDKKIQNYVFLQVESMKLETFSHLTLGLMGISLLFYFNPTNGILFFYCVGLGLFIDFLIYIFGNNILFSVLSWGVIILFLISLIWFFIGLFFFGLRALSIIFFILLSPILLPIIMIFGPFNFIRIMATSITLVLGTLIGFRLGQNKNVITGK